MEGLFRRRRDWGSVGRGLCDRGEVRRAGERTPDEATSPHSQSGHGPLSHSVDDGPTRNQGEALLGARAGLLYLAEGSSSPRSSQGAGQLAGPRALPGASASGSSVSGLARSWAAFGRERVQSSGNLNSALSSHGSLSSLVFEDGNVQWWRQGGAADPSPSLFEPLYPSAASAAACFHGSASESRRICLPRANLVTANVAADRLERPWAELPLDLLALIIGRLPAEERLLTAPAVCRQWQEAARLSAAFAVVDVDEWSQGFTLYATVDSVEGPQALHRYVQDALLSRAADLAGRDLRAVRSRQCTADSLRLLAQRCPGLERLELPDLRGAFDVEMMAAAPCLPRLQSLTLQPLFVHGAMIEDGPVQPLLRPETLIAISQSCPGLTRLDLTECRQLSSAGLVSIAQNCTGLRSLNLDSCLDANHAPAVMAAVARHCPSLTRLNAADCGVGPEALASIGRMASLRELTLPFNCFPCALPKAVGGLRELVHADLGDNPWLGDADVEALAKACPQLRFLDISSCGVTDRGILCVARHCRSLDELRADDNSISNASLAVLLASSPDIRALSIKSTLCSSSAFLLSLIAARRGKGPSSLLRLSIGRPRGGSDDNVPPRKMTLEDFQLFVATCPNLCSLGMTLLDLVPAPAATPDPSASAEEHRTGLACSRFDGQILPLPPVFSSGTASTAAAAAAGARSLPLAAVKAPAVFQSSAGETSGLRGQMAASESASWPRRAMLMVEALQPLGAQLLDLRLDGPSRSEDFEDLNEALVQLAKSCPNLHSVDLNRFRNLTDAAVADLASTWTSLEQAGFSGCPLLTDTALTTLVARCPRMRILEVSACDGISSAVFEAISDARGGGVQVLSGRSVVFRVLPPTADGVV
eukprot:TRINITY_DN6917_c0_g4_i1.p1 TRINITY_DN6917_c0_g4~~TRINITY_DN6917_c0_g4_i1.p1  ORF type:complete len:876 (+),score=157.82 TRINITY_DN6917_c0_g4_i1:188-2815(+)